ncbi:feruloyl esterase C [Parastagonospora nodorum]|uniref:Feruloyl esterase C n=1 Tax=Phaeosphaeria nodorum (strain SN15 / ATCC MYA-4574 / FGSC 10173) TaxID=321614 RepID=A0A7U2F6C2_PHANO|nr:feruloyl esterase C [Parastagonospora nodorum]QRC99548.1 feruloyl esterase C [Parastagonospora nodorum SN15]KAH3924424.1 feruloyl esterase C [Parastagonospora nodorum]KAH4130627.1 feruloyl esterase C [Parastagonospora nodorum]KAH4147252.1 feruloyl esterase C [Parastagonospora nodorum]
MLFSSSIVGALLVSMTTVLGAPASYDNVSPSTNLDVLTKRANSAGCGKTPTLKNGVNSVNVNGKQRQYTLRIPTGYTNSKPYKLIFAWHPRGGSMNDIAGGGSDGAAWAYYGQQKKAAESAILVAPNGLNAGWANNGGEDIAFLDAMRKAIEADLCVDEAQRFSTGFSYGGGMSYSIACSRSKEFKAVAVIAGGLISGCEGGNDPIAYLGIHGINDNVLPIDMGRQLRDRFVKNNGCTAQSPREPGSGSGLHVKTSYAGCRSGFPVTWIAFDGGHGPAPVEGGGDSGARTYVSDEIWNFFNGST